jgi:multidrug efflux pump subunit AcrB
MGGIEGRLFREFAVTLSVAITISLAVSLTTTPMMCAYLLAPRREDRHGRLYRAGEQAFAAILDVYDRSLTDVNFDQQQGGLEANLIIDRATAARLGLTVGQIDNTLYAGSARRR